jgi:uncharacterized protein (TIGR01370 family)
LLLACVLGAALSSGACLRSRTANGADLARVERWWILIGASYALDSVDWRHQARDAQMVVLSGDPRVPLGSLPRGTIRLGYLSVGEGNMTRLRELAAAHPDGAGAAPSYWVEPNPDWPDNVRLDIRDDRWRRILLADEVPRVLGMGFDGLMLDTVDAVPYLEDKDPVRFAGSRQALRDWLRAVRERFPRAVLVANGTQALADVAPYVDGFVVEGVFSTYDFGRRLYRPTTELERAWKLAQIDRALRVAARPVFTIEYADIGDQTLSNWASSESQRRGFRPYVGVKDLNALP